MQPLWKNDEILQCELKILWPLIIFYNIINVTPMNVHTFIGVTFIIGLYNIYIDKLENLRFVHFELFYVHR